MTNKHNAESTSDSRSSISQQLVGNLADCIYELRLTTIDTVELLHVGEFLLQLVGYTLAQIERCGGWYALIHPDDRATVQASYAQLH